MKNIGIITFWNIPNYGTFLQAYAMQKVLSDLYPNDKVRLIGYIDKRHFNHYYSLFNFDYKLFLFNPKFYKYTIKRFIKFSKIKKMKKFIDYYKQIPNTGELTSKQLEQMHFDSILIGSDIVWDYSMSLFNNDVHLFGNKLNCKNIFSYAASFGTVKLNMDVPEYVHNGINNLNMISVRDENSAEIVHKITGKKPCVVVDPTFLLDFKKIEEVKLPDYKKYIVVYGSYFSKEMGIEARKYADENDLKIICLNSLHDKYDWCDITINQDQLTPFEWLGYFKYADVIMTCTFHGLMFGLNFNKKIVFSPTQFILDKAESFIGSLGLREVLIEKKSFYEKVNFEWDYESINMKIAEIRDESLIYLKRAIKNG